MPLVQLLRVDEATSIGLWKIEETAEELKWKLQWGQEDIKRYRELRDELRGLHWLSSRVLLRSMLNTRQFIDLRVDEYGKPYLKNFPQYISISHSGDLVTVIVSNCNVGIDLQVINPKIEVLSHKFMSKAELAFLKEPDALLQIHVAWSAKEAMYKLYGKRKLEFKDHLLLKPFEWQEEGIVNGTIHKGSYHKELTIHYKKIGNYILAYVSES